MWHGVTPVGLDYDPIISETPEAARVAIGNAGPGTVKIRAWESRLGMNEAPDIQVEMRPGDHRVVGGTLIRAQLVEAGAGSKFAALGWLVI